MNHRRPPHRPPLLALGLLILLVACQQGATPAPNQATPTAPRPTPARPTIRAIVAPSHATPSARPGALTPGMAPAEATLLVDQAVGLLLDYSLDSPASADLYQAAYDGALLSLARDGLLIDRALLPLDGERGEDAATFRAAYLALAELVAPSIVQADLAHAAIRAAVDRADQCQTYFLEPGELAWERGDQPAAARYGGIGVALRGRGQPGVIEVVYPDSPAARAGLLPGDRILAVDGSAVAALDVAAIGLLLRGEAGAVTQLTILRPGEAVPRALAVPRAAIQPPPFAAESLRDGSGRPVAYLRLAAIGTDTIPALRAAITDLARDSARGWVLDLRGSEVGAIDLLPALGDLVIPAGDPTGYVVSDAGERPILANGGQRAGPLAPLAVLIDSGTILLGEALAAAARDSAGARLFGEPTAGCVATSALYPLADGSGLRITLDPIVSPERRPLHERGQRPDETVLPDPTGATDPALAAALRWLGGR